MAYSKDEIISMVQNALKTPETLYTSRFINYKGGTADERYSEIVAAELLKHLETLRAIETISRENYRTDSHRELSRRSQPVESKRDEEWRAIGLYNLQTPLNVIGKILDFQTPLKRNRSDDAGKIDLLSYNELSNIAYILELKRKDSQETLLRCALEAYTYWRIVDAPKLFGSFDLPDNTELRKAALIYQTCQAYHDFLPKDTAVRLLMRALEVDLFVLNNASDAVIESHISDTL
jgi:hypothetical protein